MIIDNVTSVNNTALQGGSSYIIGNGVTVQNSTFRNNTAIKIESDPKSGNGGGIKIDGDDCKFYNNDISYSVGAFLTHLRAAKLKGKKGLGFGAFGWFPKVPSQIDQALTDAGLENVHDAISHVFSPKATDLENYYNIAQEIAKEL